MLESFRYDKDHSIELEYRYYISFKKISAEQAASAIRAHWDIKPMSWILDVTIKEDECQIYKDHNAENLSCLRHIGLNMLRREPTKMSIADRR